MSELGNNPADSETREFAQGTVSGTTAVEDSVLDSLQYNSNGLIPAIIQDDDSDEVLMLGWMDREALRRTVTTGRVTFWSRSRQEYWRKGDTSGNRQYVRSVAHDCDDDTLLVRVEQIGVACHTGTRTCFTDRGIDAVVGVADAQTQQ